MTVAGSRSHPPLIKAAAALISLESYFLVISTLTFFLLTFGLLSPVNALTNCPNGCHCDDDTLVVECGEGTLDVLPITLNPSIQRLVIKNNKIKTIDSSIQFYAELTFLDLSNNDLVNIPQRTFSYQRKLHELHLNHNKIGQICNKTFNGLSSLLVLNLRGNLLSELEYGTFAQMPTTEQLNLGQNRISRIDPNAFDGLVNLRVLYLDDNTLTTVPSSLAFQAMPSLAELYLGTNSFDTLPADVFATSKGLTRLDLSGSGLQNISAGAFRGLEGLRYLDISDNRLQSIPTTALSILGRLEELSLGQNDFEVIAAGSFTGLKNLRHLRITAAQRLRRVESGAFAANTNLENINLSSNKMLSEFRENALSGLPHLKHLVLRENSLSTLADGFIPWASLQTLDLSDNPIVCDCRVLWLRDFLVSKNATNEQTSNLKCAFPEKLQHEYLNQLTPPLLGCAHTDPKKQAMIGILLVTIAASITALALVIYGCRRRIRKVLKGGWGSSALGRKEREYQKTFSEEEYMARQPHPCSLGIRPSAPYMGVNPHQPQYMGAHPIPVTEL